MDGWDLLDACACHEYAAAGKRIAGGKQIPSIVRVVLDQADLHSAEKAEKSLLRKGRGTPSEVVRKGHRQSLQGTELLVKRSVLMRFDELIGKCAGGMDVVVVGVTSKWSLGRVHTLLRKATRKLGIVEAQPGALKRVCASADNTDVMAVDDIVTLGK